MRCLMAGDVCVCGRRGFKTKPVFFVAAFLVFGCIFDETRASSSGARQACRGQPF